MQTDKTINIGKAIHDELQKQERSVSWMAKKLNINRMQCYRIFKRYSIDTQLLLQISLILDYDFFELYSKSMK